MRRKQARIGRPPKPWLADMHVRIDRDIKRAIELRAREEHKGLGALVEEALRLLESDRRGYPKILEIFESIQSRTGLRGPDREAEEERFRRLDAAEKRLRRRRDRRRSR